MTTANYFCAQTGDASFLFALKKPFFSVFSQVGHSLFCLLKSVFMRNFLSTGRLQDFLKVSFLALFILTTSNALFGQVPVVQSSSNNANFVTNTNVNNG